MTTSRSQSKSNSSTISKRQEMTDLKTEIEDLKQQRQVLEELLQSNLFQLERTRTLLNGVMDSVNAGVVAVDQQGRVTVFNHTAAFMTGVSPEEAIGEYYPELGLYRARENDLSPLMITLSSGEKIVDGERNLPVRGVDTTLPVRYFTGLLRNTKGRKTGAVEVFEDLSEIKLLEDRVSRGRTLAALGEMAANVAHELRNPLGGIGGYAAMLYEVLDDNPDARHYVQKLIEGVDSLNRVATNLLAFTRPVEPRFYLDDLRKVLREVIDYVAIECEQSGSRIALRTRFTRKPLEIELDSELLRQSFLNLLKNAVQAVNPQRGEITVRIERKVTEGKCYVSISDNGHGIPTEQQDKLFNPFHTTRTRGTGLGLPIARKNIELHGGSINFRNNRQGGATFLVEFPLPEEPFST